MGDYGTPQAELEFFRCRSTLKMELDIPPQTSTQDMNIFIECRPSILSTKYNKVLRLVVEHTRESCDRNVRSYEATSMVSYQQALVRHSEIGYE